MNFILLLFRGEVDRGYCRRVIVASLLGESEDDAGETLFLPQHLDDGQINVLFLSRVSASLTCIKEEDGNNFTSTVTPRYNRPASNGNPLKTKTYL